MQLADSNLVSYKWIGESDRVREFLIREGTFLGERKMKRRFLLSAVLGLSAVMFLANVSQAQSYFYGYYYPEEGRFASTKLNHGMYTYSTVTPFWNALNDAKYGRGSGVATGTPLMGQSQVPSRILPSGSGGYNTTPEPGFGQALSGPDLVPSRILPSGSGGYNTTPEPGFGQPLVRSAPAVSSPANIRVIVPNPLAVVYFGNHLTKSTGTDRVFQSPAINPGSYNYQIKVVSDQGGQSVVQERTITVSPGQSVVVDFSAPKSAR
jgi:uncharacterized protein (TIGR03000 family)